MSKKSKKPINPSIWTVKGLKQTKSTGDFVDDALLQHDQDQKAVKKALQLAHRRDARKEDRKPKYIKSDFETKQKNLRAIWMFPIDKLEEFLGLFQNEVYEMLKRRTDDVIPIINNFGYSRPVDARKLVAIICMQASVTKDLSVDYYFWIFSGWVYFGCVLPHSEKVDLNAPWIKPALLGGKVHGYPNGAIPDGAIPVYARMVSFESGRMVGVYELAKRIVKNKKHRDWAINFAMKNIAFGRKIDRLYKMSIQKGEHQ